jgi:Subtilase family
VTEQDDSIREDDSSPKMEDRIVDEVEYIRVAFSERSIDIEVVPRGTGLGYMYARGQLLVLERYFEGVVESLRRQRVPFGPGPMKRNGDGGNRDGKNGGNGDGDNGDNGDEHPQDGEPSLDPNRYPHVLPGLLLLYISGKSVPDVLDEIDRELGEGCATPNHVLTVAQGASPDEAVGPCAATDPEVVYSGTEPYPGICHCNSGAGVRVYIADTGLIADKGSHRSADGVIVDSGSEHPWLAGVRGKEDPQSPKPSDGLLLKPYAGHGTFVAGVMRCIAPAADIFVGNVFRTGGSGLETEFAADLQEALNRGTDIFHLSVASTTRNNRQLLSFWTWLKQLRQHKGIVCVAPAGNSGSRLPHWPAASPEVASVGALAADWRSRASFSNYGGWVDAYAPGRNLINAYASGEFVVDMVPYKSEHRRFHGMAQWSGTSFSSPIVTGLIADRMWRTGENGIEAAAAVLRGARCHAIAGVGAIVLPCGEDRGCRCAAERDCYCGEDRGCRCGTPLRPRL